jgi:small GTP-binding protein
MDLKDYENAKFELTDMLRAAALVAKRDRPDDHQPYADLFARLAEDRFNVVVVGRFSRGKTSLMNAMLETERLPTGIVPLTSVITTVGYGSSERAYIEYEGSRLPSEIALEALPEYVTQQQNPGNARHVAIARVQLPCEMLRRGFYLVDTPGLGSSIIENTRTTEGFLSEADAFILVTSYDSPLSEEELRVLRAVAQSPERVFLVVNKQDSVVDADKDAVLAHVRDQARRVYGEAPPQIFSVSARDALDAIKRRDGERFHASGVQALKETLVRFLLSEKQTQLLLRMTERIARLPNSPDAVARLRAFAQRVADRRGDADRRPLTALAAAADADMFVGCPVCAHIEREVYEFLCTYQYEVSAQPDRRDALAKDGGLCAFHTWQYDGVASPRGTCIGFSGVLAAFTARLRTIARDAPPGAVSDQIDGVGADHRTCSLCRVRERVEETAIVDLARLLKRDRDQAVRRFTGACMPHLRRVVRAVGDEELMRALLLREADTLERVAENMQRYAMKHDGIRRFLASDEEIAAARRALMLLAGHRDVNAVWKAD